MSRRTVGIIYIGVILFAIAGLMEAIFCWWTFSWERTEINPTFAKEIIEKSQQEKEGYEAAMAVLNSISKKELKELHALIKTDMENKTNTVVDTSDAINICNATRIEREIELRRGALKYDYSLEGYFKKKLFSDSCVTYYIFETLSGEKIIVYTATWTILPVYNFWETYKNGEVNIYVRTKEQTGKIPQNEIVRIEWVETLKWVKTRKIDADIGKMKK